MTKSTAKTGTSKAPAKKQNEKLPSQRAIRESDSAQNYEFSQMQMARILGVSEQDVRGFVRRGMPVKTATRLDVRDCFKWRMEDLLRQKAKPRTSVDARDALAKARRKKIDLETAKLRNELISSEIHSQTIGALMSLVAAQLDGLGPRLAGELSGYDDPAQIQRRLFEEGRSIRESIASGVLDIAQQMEAESNGASDSADDDFDEAAA